MERTQCVSCVLAAIISAFYQESYELDTVVIFISQEGHREIA